MSILDTGGTAGGGPASSTPGIVGSTNTATLAAGATQFSCLAFGWSATEAQRQLPLPACTVVKLIIRTSTGQPAGQDLVLTVRKNGVDTALVLTLAAGSAAGVYAASGSIAFAEGDLFGIKGAQQAGAAASANLLGWSVAYS